MSINKKDLMITLVDEANFRVSIRTRILWVFSVWSEILISETENSPEHPIEFKTLEEAKNFCELITK